MLPQLKRKGKDSEKLRNDSTKKLLARYILNIKFDLDVILTDQKCIIILCNVDAT